MANIVNKALKSIVGKRRWISAREAYYCYKRTYQRDAELDFIESEHYRKLRENIDDPRLVVSRNRIAAYRDKHAGQRCFIIGNGPSLNRTDLSLLKNEITFGSNRIYLMQKRNGFLPTYYVSVNPHVIRQFADDIQALPMPKFLSFNGVDALNAYENTFFIRSPFDQTFRFCYEVNNEVCEGATVTFVMLQIAFFMGFTSVYLIGVDHSFAAVGTPHALVESSGADPNHFDASYFGKGVKWQLPDLDTSEIAYNLAKIAFLADNRIIRDATIDGKLNVFPKIHYESIFASQHK